MGRILLLLISSTAYAGTLWRPWVGVLAYYTLAILFPAGIWPWIFRGERLSYSVALCTIGSLALHMVVARHGLRSLRNPQNVLIGLIWLGVYVSFLFPPYGHNESVRNILNSAALMSAMNYVMLFYFISAIAVQEQGVGQCLFWMVAAITGYYTYWANAQYLFHGLTSTRLGGPGTGTLYSDENVFGMLFVVGIPFLYFGGYLIARHWLRLALWLVIPFAWHAIFLTGSRGALLSAGATAALMALRSRSRTVGLGLALGLVAAFAWQGGDYLKGRTDTIVEYQGDGSAAGRVEVWTAGLGMIWDFPLTGVGLGNFMRALPDYSSKENLIVAHNTTVQLATECGVMSALAYLGLFVHAFLEDRRWRKAADAAVPAPVQALRDASLCGLAGFFICSVFLNLITYEILYALLLMRNFLHVWQPDPAAGSQEGMA